MKDQILILGGNGKTGRKVVEKLNQHGIQPRIGSRQTDPSFDWYNPDTWRNVLQSIETAYITFQPDLAIPEAKPLIEKFTNLAVEMGVKKLVILSGRGEEAAQECEEIVKNSGVKWAVVRADWFNQNFSESFLLEPIRSGQVAMPRSETKIPFIDTEDIAEIVTQTLISDEHINQVHEVTGPRLLTFKDAIEEISKATGREIQYYPVSIEDYLQALKSHNVPEDYIKLLDYLFTHVLDGHNSYTTNGVENVLGRKPTDFASYAAETAKTGIWNN